MCRVIFQQGTDLLLTEDISVPSTIVDRQSFHRWVASDEFPDEGRIDYLQKEIWIDMSEEQLFSHNQVKLEVTVVLGTLAKTSRLGRFFQDGARIEHPEADISAVPDGVYVSNESIETMRVRAIPGVMGGYVRFEGTPDMVLEVVSDSSVRKDTIRLKQLYWAAGVREYWLVDAREEPLSFDILRHTTKGYSAVRKQGGWVKSTVFGKSFRLTQEADTLGFPSYTLGIR